MVSSRLLAVGSYTPEVGGNGTGVTTFWLDEDSGGLARNAELPLAAPAWLEWHPTLPVLYAANELEAGRVTAIAVGDGHLRVLGAARSTGGAAPCHLAVTPD